MRSRPPLGTVSSNTWADANTTARSINSPLRSGVGRDEFKSRSSARAPCLLSAPTISTATTSENSDGARHISDSPTRRPPSNPTARNTRGNSVASRLAVDADGMRRASPRSSVIHASTTCLKSLTSMSQRLPFLRIPLGGVEDLAREASLPSVVRMPESLSRFPERFNSPAPVRR